MSTRRPGELYWVGQGAWKKQGWIDLKPHRPGLVLQKYPDLHMAPCSTESMYLADYDSDEIFEYAVDDVDWIDPAAKGWGFAVFPYYNPGMKAADVGALVGELNPEAMDRLVAAWKRYVDYEKEQ